MAVQVRETPAAHVGAKRRGIRLRWQPVSPKAIASMVVLIVAAFVIGHVTGTRTTQTVIGLPGPTRLTSGIPVGYPHTQAGALSAVANFIELTGGEAGRVVAHRPALIDALASSDGKANVKALLDGNDQTTTTMFGSPSADFTATATPISERVVSATPDAVTVDSWVVLTFTRPGLPLASAFWGGIHTSVVWEGDWKVRNATALAAPIPSSQGAAGDPNELLKGFSASRLFVGATP
jgi:hypothetical protein